VVSSLSNEVIDHGGLSADTDAGVAVTEDRSFHLLNQQPAPPRAGGLKVSSRSTEP